MRILSFILVFSFAFAAPALNTTADSKLPGAGAFIYSGAQLGNAASVAHLTLTPRGKHLPASTQGNASDVARG